MNSCQLKEQIPYHLLLFDCSPLDTVVLLQQIVGQFFVLHNFEPIIVSSLRLFHVQHQYTVVIDQSSSEAKTLIRLLFSQLIQTFLSVVVGLMLNWGVYPTVLKNQ